MIASLSGTPSCDIKSSVIQDFFAEKMVLSNFFLALSFIIGTLPIHFSILKGKKCVVFSILLYTGSYATVVKFGKYCHSYTISGS